MTQRFIETREKFHSPTATGLGPLDYAHPMKNNHVHDFNMAYDPTEPQGTELERAHKDNYCTGTATLILICRQHRTV